MSQAVTATRSGAGMGLAVLGAISFSHMINDVLQALLPAVYPILKANYALSFGQVGMISTVYQLTASILQPLIGHFTDRRPVPYSLPVGMALTGIGLLLVSGSGSYAGLLFAVALIGIGSAIFHPESSRVARLASGGQHGFAQSIFQVGGNVGSALGPLMAAFVVAPRGQGAIGWVALVAVVGMVVLGFVSRWYSQHVRFPARATRADVAPPSRRHVAFAMSLLLALMLSKFVYLASMGIYYQFYLMGRFHLSLQQAQLCLFVFLGAVAVGTIAGGPIGDRIGRKRVILCSIVGVLPFSLALPHVGFAGTVALTVPIGLLLASAFPAIVVYAQELMPNRIGTVSGLMFGLAFGFGGLGAAALGVLADKTSIGTVFFVCSFLPALGLLAAFLPGQARSGVSKRS
jgi:FSR family fosmidomycin resistance protein-like MFS transporter